MTTVREFVEQEAPDDVRAVVHWLEREGYLLTRTDGGASGWFAKVVYTRRCEVTIYVERGQWYLDVAAEPGRAPIWYGYAYPASIGGEVEDAFGYDWADEPKGRPLPRQLPPGISWAETLPDVLEWLTDPGIDEAVAGVKSRAYAKQRIALLQRGLQDV